MQQNVFRLPHPFRGQASRWPALVLFLSVFSWRLGAGEIDIETQLRLFKEQNEQLQQQVLKQQHLIDSLSSKVSNMEQAQKNATEISHLMRESTSESLSKLATAERIVDHTKLNLSGHAAVGFFNTGSEGMYPNAEFRVDDVRLFLDAKVWEDIYAYVELNIVTRDEGDWVHMGEVYLEFERLLRWQGLDPLVNVRAGRFYIPFGEEYQMRYPMNDPLISHSLADLWGIDEGIELYGSRGKISYAIAVQNGGHSAASDFTSDKSIAGRISYEPAKWLHLSASGMRTGDLSVQNDGVSEMWFGGGFFRSIGSPNTTTRFHADLAEGDVEFLLPRGHVKFAGGAVFYNDNDLAADNGRKVYYYSAEGVLKFTKKLYGAARYSQILSDDGFPVLGYGNWNDYFDANLTENLWRLSLGLGYQPNPNLLFKVEYSIERGHIVGGNGRDHEDFLGALAAIRF